MAAPLILPVLTRLNNVSSFGMLSKCQAFLAAARNALPMPDSEDDSSTDHGGLLIISYDTVDTWHMNSPGYGPI